MNTSHSIKNITTNVIAAAVLALGVVAAVSVASPAQAETGSGAEVKLAPDTLKSSGWTGWSEFYRSF